MRPCGRGLSHVGALTMCDRGVINLIAGYFGSRWLSRHTSFYLGFV